MDPLALVTRQGDNKWTSFLDLIVWSTYYAEENGITSATAKTQLRNQWTTLFGVEYTYMVSSAVDAVGNYGEIYERHAQNDVERGGLNDLYSASSGAPLHYPLPGVIMRPLP